MNDDKFVVVTRDTGDKMSCDVAVAIETVKQLLVDVQKRLFDK